MSKVTDTIMKRRLVENPFGTWNTIPELRESATLNEQREFSLLWNETATEDLSESEVSEYLEKVGNNSMILNEAGYAEQGWFGVSPFAWTEGFKIRGIFKPLKWLALPLIGGVVMLLAGIWKLLKEGKKQIAIARVRAWINRLVVIADSGLKKTRNTKDSLFLIRQRYRRDILQNAVKVATALGIDIKEKDTKPESVETSLNESAASSSIRVKKIYDSGKGQNLTKVIEFDVNGKTVEVYFSYKTDQPGFVWPANTQEEKLLRSQWNYDDESVYKPIKDKLNAGEDIGIHEGDVLENGEFKHSDNDTEEPENVEEPQSDQQDPSVGEIKPDVKIPSDVPSQPQLPDDSRVDWSLMNSVRASQWFGLKHKTTNFWKEAKSVAVIQSPDGNNDPLRFCGLLVSQVSMSLTLIANSGVAQSYASIMNKYIEVLTNIKTGDDVVRRDGRKLDGRFSQSREGSVMDSKYSVFDEDFKIFEALSPQDLDLIANAEKNTEFQEWVSSVYNIDAAEYINNVQNNTVSVNDLKEKFKEWNQANYMLNWMIQYGNSLQSELENSPLRNQKQNNVKVKPELVDKYLIAALSKILANTNYNDWQVHSDAYSQMLKFINELTKVVNTVIDSVAKKAEDRLGAGQQGIEGAVLRFIGSDADPKQNRSLKNLWNNLGVSKLQQRTIVHCQEIVASPEMQYYLDMFMITVPSIIKSKLMSQPVKNTQETTAETSQTPEV